MNWVGSEAMSKHGIHINDGDVLNHKYVVLSHIATGGMSEVYLVSDLKQPSQKWAVKVSSVTSKLARKLIDEAKILSALDHPTLPYVADFFSTDQYFYLVMEYIEGNTLTDYFEQNNRKLSVETILDIGVQLSDVLHYLHKQEPDPIIYRDIKPGNIMIKENGQIVLVDFGIARKYQEDQLKDTVRIGTVGFAAPEQFEKKQTDARTDIFSLGALLYYLFSKGKYVYIAQKPIRDFQKGLPSHLEQCIQTCTQLEPEKRIQDIREAKILLLKAKEEWEKGKLTQFIYKHDAKFNLAYWKYPTLLSLFIVGLSLFLYFLL